MLEQMLPATRPPMRLRRLLLALLAFGLIGISVELVLLEHYEDPSMFVPFAAIAVSLAAVVLHALSNTAATARVLQAAMAGLILSGLAGVVLHYQGSLEFQLDMDPEISRWDVFWKVMHMKAPPTLAPGIMVQLGLLGLVSTYRHQAFDRTNRTLPTGEPI
jgi:hypothetical protein